MIYEVWNTWRSSPLIRAVTTMGVWMKSEKLMMSRNIIVLSRVASVFITRMNVRRMVRRRGRKSRLTTMLMRRMTTVVSTRIAMYSLLMVVRLVWRYGRLRRR